eukprot:9482911-Pyramimonas_sp.AAC.1
MAGTGDTIDKCVKCVEDTFGTRKLNKHTCTNCAVIYTQDKDDSVTLDQDEYIKQPRPIQHPEHTGAGADAQAPKMVADVFPSLRGASATCPGTDRHASATTERDYQETAGLP